MQKVYDKIIIGTGFSASFFIEGMNNSSETILVVDTGLKKPKIDRIEKNKYNYSIKTFNGSDFATKKWHADETNFLNSSYAFGGLGNVWGACCEYYDDVILNKMGIQINREDFYSVFNSRVNLFENDTFCYSKSTKVSREFKLKPSLLALSYDRCVRCGNCLYGCLEDAIFNPANLMSSLITRPNLDYRPGYYVNRIEKVGNVWSLECSSPENSSQTEKFFASKIYIGAGAINTSKILINSFEFIKSIQISDSAMVTVPLLSMRPATPINYEEISLCGQYAKLKIFDTEIHGQIYNPSEYTVEAIKRKLFFLPQGLARKFSSRIYPFQWYLPSDLSPIYKLSKLNTGLNIQVEDRSNFRTNISKIESNFSVLFDSISYKYLGFLAKISRPFQSYHYGSISLEIGKELYRPSCIDGSLPFIKDIYLIDSSVLKYIPSGPHTMTMASLSYFIGKSHGKLGS